jgi:hypothetical protein
MEKPKMRQSKGTLRYSRTEGKYWLVVDVDPDIVALARALIPPYFRLNRQKYDPHITVVRNEIPPNSDKWNLHAGEIIEFQYDPNVRNGKVYWWLDAFCDRLCEIRMELGLTPHSDMTKPPDAKSCFHITIGNTKCIS